ncbi:MAG: TonB-dependent receptor [Nitrospira sp. CR1.2]|nr:TonB-dependent receptor [Nitrospira sp. CR1.2]
MYVIPRMILVLLCALGVGAGFYGTVAAEEPALREEPVEFNIPPQPLSQALRVFRDQSGIRFIHRAELIQSEQSEGVIGRYASRDALSLMLKGTGLAYYTADDGTVVLERAATSGASSAAAAPAVAAGTLGPEEPAAASGAEEAVKVPLVEIIGTSENALDYIPGSGRVITKETIEQNHRLTINEALREVPGVHVRDEDGLGIRPNIGIRGLDPTRSRKVHIMEDGVPIMMMPYADPSSYYFPPIFRFDRIEVLKGSGQLLYGPQTIGGVMNFITRMPSAKPEGNFQFWGGNNNYFNTHFDYGGTWGKSGYMVDYTHYQSDTPRFTNVRAKVDDITFKTVQELSDRTQIMAKFNYYREDSGIGYQGLTESEWGSPRGQDRQTLFKNDHFDFRRMGAHVAVNHMFTANLTSTTNFFGHYMSRDWTRQTTQGVNADGSLNGALQFGNAIPATAFGAVPGDARFTNEREYWVYGVESRFKYDHSILGVNATADFGARYMFEESDRKQLRNTGSGIGVTSSCFLAVAGSTCLNENNLRTTNAYALFFQERLIFGKFTITPGVRVEHINYDQYNRLSNNGNGSFGKANFTEVLPGVGVTYAPFKNHTFFFGAHRGMSPPQISDAITGTGAVVDLGPELSWTYELGTRGNLAHWAGYEFTLFQMDFDNQIISQSAAGGTGATLTSAGETRHRGIEFASSLDLWDAFKGRDKEQDVTLDLNYTWVAQAEFIGTRNSSITGAALLPTEAAVVSVSGNRLPYSPKHLLTAGIGYTNRAFGLGTFNARLEAQCISDQFGDDRNLVAPTANGQRGMVRGWCMMNASVNQYVKKINTTFFFVAKNMLDQATIMDRTRGIYPGLPALWQAGAKWTF